MIFLIVQRDKDKNTEHGFNLNNAETFDVEYSKDKEGKKTFSKIVVTFPSGQKREYSGERGQKLFAYLNQSNTHEIRLDESEKEK